MIAPSIIDRAAADGVTLFLSATGSIKATGAEQAVARWLPAIRESKPAILDALQTRNLKKPEIADSLPDGFAERAAIIEHDGGVPRAWAEGFARLSPNHPPAGVDYRRWVRFVDDCGLFLDRRWAAKAAALGWGPVELFGCDRLRPLARVDLAGLLWLLDGRKLAALSGETALVEGADGHRQTYRRCPIREPGRVALAWELAP